MAKVAAGLICFILSSSFLAVSSFDCSFVVEEVQSGVLNWRGAVDINVPVPTDENGWLIVMTFDQVFTGLGVWDVWTESNGTAKWAQITPREDNAVLPVGGQLSYTFRINYGTDVPKPQLESLTFQGIQMCR